MTIEQIQQQIGCTAEQAKGLLAHFQATAHGTWTTTERTIKHCGVCGKRQWHDGDTCIVCGGTRP